MSAKPMVTDEEILRFAEDGAIVIRGAFDQRWIDVIAKGIEKNKKNPSPFGENLKAHPNDPGYYFNDYLNWRNIGEFKDYVMNSPAKDIAGELLKKQTEYILFYHEHVLTKDAGAQKVTPWHVDQSYYPLDGAANCSIWMPIDPVPEETTVRFVKGSHKWPTWFYPKKFETGLNYQVSNNNKEKTWSTVPEDIETNTEYDILKWAVEPGDCVVFHFRTLHGAPGNTMVTPRRIISTRWCGDDCRFAARPWTTSPPDYKGLNIGDKLSLNQEDFPILWKQSD